MRAGKAKRERLWIDAVQKTNEKRRARDEESDWDVGSSAAG
jgi:hypothetical protein